MLFMHMNHFSKFIVYKQNNNNASKYPVHLIRYLSVNVRRLSKNMSQKCKNLYNTIKFLKGIFFLLSTFTILNYEHYIIFSHN